MPVEVFKQVNGAFRSACLLACLLSVFLSVFLSFFWKEVLTVWSERWTLSKRSGIV